MSCLSHVTMWFPCPVFWQLLEKQLKKVAADERKTGIDLSGLRAKIKREIAEIDRRL